MSDNTIDTYGLNSKQYEAVSFPHDGGPLMVLAGPGSGKTTVVTHRVRHLTEVQKVNPESILVITFTKAAAEDMKKRYAEMCGDSARNVLFGTFHSFFFTALRQKYGLTLNNVLKDEERKELIKNILTHLKLDFSNEDFVAGVSNEISYVKNELVDLEYHNPIDIGSEDFREIYALYSKWTAKNKKIDFDDMLVKCYNLFRADLVVLSYWREKYPYILVDEFQDINKVQYETIKLLSGDKKNIFVVGDDDQSIYSFRGARPEFLLNFPKEFAIDGVLAKTITLDKNYRSTNQIISLAKSVIKENKSRFNKQYGGTDKTGMNPVFISPKDPRAEANYIANKTINLVNEGFCGYDEIAVIYRTNMQALAIIETFFSLRVPFRVKDKTPNIFEHWVAKDVIAYMRLALSREYNSEFERIINKPSRYMSKEVIAQAKKRGGSIFYALYNEPSLNRQGVARLEELNFYLNALKNRKAVDAVKYIRASINYDEYIKSYAEFRRVNSKVFFELIDEIQAAAKPFDNITDFLDFCDKTVKEINDLNKQNAYQNTNNAPSVPSVTLTTMHSAKGLEFDVVFVAGAVDGIVPYEKSKTERAIEEERRLFYVALTRAKKNLYVSSFQTRYDSDREPTRFLDEILKESRKKNKL